MAQRLSGIINVGAINCLSQEELCEEFSIHQKVVYNEIRIYSESKSDEGERYQGTFEANQIINSATKKM